jgi:lipopolysaccharide export system protein LptC
MAQNSTISPTLAPVHANMRSTVEFASAKRHSRIVAMLKTLLPLSAIAISALFVMFATTTNLPFADVAVDRIGLKQGKLVMERPKMAGFDKNNRPYDVRALQAIQDLSQPGKVLLKSIEAKLPMDATSFATVDASSGIFDTTSERLSLQDRISIVGARGMDLLLLDADIDIKSGTMESAKPVKVTSESTRLAADSVRVEQSGKRIVFDKRVKMTIIRPVKRGNSTAGN